MRITTQTLREYAEMELQIRALEDKKAAIREAILLDGRSEIEMGDMMVKVSSFEQERTLGTKEVREILGEEQAKQVIKTVECQRVSVKKIA